LCGSPELEPFARARGPGLHAAQARCRGCALLIADPQADAAEMDAYYAGPFYEREWSDPGAVERENHAMYRRYEWPLLSSLWAPRPPPRGGTIGEVGCGYGVMLRLLAEQGYRVLGCELGPRAVAHCRGLGLEVSTGHQLAARQLDAVVALQVIEHVPDPRAFVGELVAAVRPGGVVAVATEDAVTAQYAWQRALDRVRGRVPEYRSSTDHTFVFQARHLEQLLAEAGCESVRARSYSRVPARESLHWKLYKGLLRAVDRATGHGELLMALGWRRA
jgi:2-polyprenyl-3-methyl-5-hydroxy-6-metoxy-1,4-benzoquinol methylase